MKILEHLFDDEDEKTNDSDNHIKNNITININSNGNEINQLSQPMQPNYNQGTSSISQPWRFHTQQQPLHHQVVHRHIGW